MTLPEWGKHHLHTDGQYYYWFEGLHWVMGMEQFLIFLQIKILTSESEEMDSGDEDRAGDFSFCHG